MLSAHGMQKAVMSSAWLATTIRRTSTLVVYDPWDGTHLNANTAVLARSGSGKSFATKLGMLRGLTRGVTAYVIDPEGEYADMARAAGGRVLSPGVPGQGMNPFVIDKGDSEEMLQRIGSLRRLIEVMVGESLGAERRASLDHALAGYYARPRERTGFRDFYKYLQEDEAGDRDPESSSGQALARLLRPFATGSLRHLLSDERGPGWREFAGTLGQLQAGCQAGNGMACRRAKARLNWVSQGQRRGRCKVRRRAERVIRPTRAKTRRLRVLVITVRSPRPIRAVQRARLCAITWTASQAPLAAKRPDGMWFSPTPYLRSRMAFSTSAWRR